MPDFSRTPARRAVREANSLAGTTPAPPLCFQITKQEQHRLVPNLSWVPIRTREGA